MAKRECKGDVGAGALDVDRCQPREGLVSWQFPMYTQFNGNKEFTRDLRGFNCPGRTMGVMNK